VGLEAARNIAKVLSHGQVTIPLGLNVSEKRIRAAIREHQTADSQGRHGAPDGLP